MKINYKIEIHRRKGKKNETYFKTSWKDKKSKYSTFHIEFCCKEIEEAFNRGFFTIPHDRRNLIDVKFEDRGIKYTKPIFCLDSMNEDGWGDGGCPHQEIIIPINFCPFCSTKIETFCVEKKRITHECKKVKREYEECEDEITEEILETTTKGS